MSNDGALFTFYTLTPLHAGAGEAGEVMDLAIQREKHTEFPVVYSSSLKGSLRWFCDLKDHSATDRIFGKEGAETGAGEVVFTDAKILFFPVRSSEGVFKWVTSPFVLKRFKRDLQFINRAVSELASNENRDDEKGLTFNGGSEIVLEDFALSLNGGARGIDKLASLLPKENQEEIRERLVIVSDNVFKTLVTSATQVIARNVLKEEEKTSENLWYEEVVPADTLFYTVMKPVGRIPANDASSLNQLVRLIKNEILQVGGNETVGYGFVKMSSDLSTIFKEQKRGGENGTTK
jgi:CRISPR-associated protein Cmr4